MLRLIRCSIFPFELLWQAQLSFSVYTGHNQRKLKFQPFGTGKKLITLNLTLKSWNSRHSYCTCR